MEKVKDFKRGTWKIQSKLFKRCKLWHNSFHCRTTNYVKYEAGWQLKEWRNKQNWKKGINKEMNKCQTNYQRNEGRMKENNIWMNKWMNEQTNTQKKNQASKGE